MIIHLHSLRVDFFFFGHSLIYFLVLFPTFSQKSNIQKSAQYSVAVNPEAEWVLTAQETGEG